MDKGGSIHVSIIITVPYYGLNLLFGVSIIFSLEINAIISQINDANSEILIGQNVCDDAYSALAAVKMTVGAVRGTATFKIVMTFSTHLITKLFK